MDARTYVLLSVDLIVINMDYGAVLFKGINVCYYF